MSIVERAVKIDAPVDLVYRVSQDYSVRYDWDPFPEKISVVANASPDLRIGTRVLVRSRLGMEMVVEFVQLSPPGCAAIRMVSGPKFLRKFAGSWTFVKQGQNSTLARFRYSLATRPTWLAWVGDRIATGYFSHTVGKRLDGLKRYCERAAAKASDE